jgi:hypothetical protein
MWSNILVEHLEQSRVGETSGVSRRPRGKRINIAPGKGVIVRDLLDSEEEEDNIESEEDAENNQSEEEAETNSSSSEEEAKINNSEKSDVNNNENIKLKLDIHDFVLVNFGNNKNRYFVGQILSITKNTSYEVKYLRKTVGAKETYFSYPLVPDIEDTKEIQIVRKLNYTPLRRERFIFPGLDLTDVE